MTDKAKRLAAATAIATAIAIPAEGLRQWAYYDPPGVLTVCYGHTGADVVAGRRYDLAECDGLLTADMRRAISTVERCVPGLPAPVLASFADAVFNSGPRIVCDPQHSTAARLLAAGNYAAACQQHPRWNKSRIAGVLVPLPGLTKRTNLRMQVCLS